MWEAKTLLRNTSYGISEDFPKPIATNRRKLYPIFSEAKNIAEGPGIIKMRQIEHKRFDTVSTIDRLQGKVHHNNFNERSNKDTLVFGGALSEYHGKNIQ